jgi:phospholipid/cholesterol/gamma-HCH transport system ATP-binding protein
MNFLSYLDFRGNEKLLPGSLSGGMQKRVGVARSIIMDPEVILYDEPTAGLDPYNTRKIQEVILTLKRSGTTSILVTHDMPTAFAVCDRMILLLSGKVAAEGRTEDLQKDKKGILFDFITGEKV